MHDDDPEVIADLQLRARTERQRPDRGVPSYSPPVIVTDWPCRGCGEPVGVTADALDRLAIFNRILAANGEEPLDRARIVFCDKCRAKGKAMQADRNRAHVDKLRGYIQALKKSREPEQERELILQIEKLGHPDVPGLVQALRERIANKGRKPSGER